MPLLRQHSAPDAARAAWDSGLRIVQRDDSDEGVVVIGNVLKDSKYLERLKEATALDPLHPRHHGVRMQAHHIVSAKGVAMLGADFGRKLEQFGYDINVLQNLVFMPSTLQGACHLGVQLHRGDHSSVAPDADNAEPHAYHEFVKLQLRTVRHLIEGKCPKEHPQLATEARRAMDSVSRLLLGFIQRQPAVAPLTRVATAFSPRSKTGCSGVDSILEHHGPHGAACPVERNHAGSEGEAQCREGITLPRQHEYHLRVGR